MTRTRKARLTGLVMLATGGTALAIGCGESPSQPSAVNLESAPQTATQAAQQSSAQSDTAGQPSSSPQQAEKAALRRTGGGEVLSVEPEDAGGYDVEIIKGGSEYSIELDESLNVVGEESEQLETVPGPDGERAKKAALDAAGGGELISIELDDDGYDASIIKGDEEISIELDSAFNVTGEERETLNR